MGNEKPDQSTEAFDHEAEASSPTFLFELWLFLKNNKKWWLAPIIVIFVVFGALLQLSATGAAPFIYTLF